jgi:alpha-glucosidase
MLLSLRGTPVLYQGDEIGLTDGELSHDEILDPVGLRFWPAYQGRDPERTPMPWTNGPNGGFTPAESRPWLPMADPTTCNVADQQREAGSVLWFVHDVVALRRRSSDLNVGAYESMRSPDATWMWRRGAHTVVTLNLSDDRAEVSLAARTHTVAIGTDRSRDGSTVAANLALGPWEGVILLEES